jgi:hypothetical protein
MTVSLTAFARSARDTCSGAFCEDAQEEEEDRKGGTSQCQSIGYTREKNRAGARARHAVPPGMEDMGRVGKQERDVDTHAQDLVQVDQRLLIRLDRLFVPRRESYRPENQRKKSRRVSASYRIHLMYVLITHVQDPASFPPHPPYPSPRPLPLPLRPCRRPTPSSP